MVDLHRVRVSATHHDRSASYPRLARALLARPVARDERPRGAGAILRTGSDPDLVAAADHLFAAVGYAHASYDGRAGGDAQPDAASNADTACHAQPAFDASSACHPDAARHPNRACNAGRAPERGPDSHGATLFDAHAGTRSIARDRSA